MQSLSWAASEGRRESAKWAIVDHAIALFLERGYAEVSMDAIASAVGVTSRTVYRYFSSKEQILSAFALRSAKFLPDAIASRPREEPPLEAALRAASGWSDATEEEFWTWVTICRDLPDELRYVEGVVQSGFRALVADALKARLTQPAISRGDAELFGGVAVSVLISVSERSIIRNEDRRPLIAEAIRRLKAAMVEAF
ncbi:TetR/AcrR family transcriptional regulator [Jatrophihabitans sp. DSM 45814]